MFFASIRRRSGLASYFSRRRKWNASSASPHLPLSWIVPELVVFRHCAWASTEASSSSPSTTATATMDATPSSSLDRTSTTTTISTAVRPMDLVLLYRFLRLESFSQPELEQIFDEIRDSRPTLADNVLELRNELDACHYNHVDNAEQEAAFPSSSNECTDTVDQSHLRDFLVERIRILEHENGLPSKYEEDALTQQHRIEYASAQALSLLKALSSPTDDRHKELALTKEEFLQRIIDKSTAVDVRRTLPVAVSMLLVGSSVGIITPVMPFVVQNLGLTSGQYGFVVSAFALAKMAGNVPSAILVERHGRKPYLVYSLSIIAFGVGGIGMATQFEHLWVCRLLTGMGVAALSTAATMTIADISTPRNRASTMAPIMSAFAAGTALGPALGGYLADSVGVNPTFYLVGASYFLLTGVNQLLLTETKPTHVTFPWQQDRVEAGSSEKKANQGVVEAIQDAMSQWAPLMSDERVRNVVIMNGFYWVGLAGSQMTLLPLMLTDPHGLAMSATGVGQVYMGMSAVQVLGNPILATFVDRIGKGPAIVVGCSLISTSMAMLPFCSDLYQLAATLGVWSTGSTMLSTAPVAYISDTVAEEKRAQAIALLRTAGDVGFLLGASGMGALADWTGNMDVAMQTSAGVLLTATGWFGARQFLNSKLPSKPQV